MAENRSQVKKDDICQKWKEMDFHVFPVMVIEVARKTMAEMAENGRKWISAGKWQKMDFRAFPVIPLLLKHHILIIIHSHPISITLNSFHFYSSIINKSIH